MRRRKSGLGLLGPWRTRKEEGKRGKEGERERIKRREKKIMRREKRIMKREKRIIRKERRTRAWACVCMGVSCANLGFKY